MNILIVDDHSENLYYLQSLFSASKHQVFDATNGEVALEVLKNQHIDMIISDILMPYMDGFSLCRKIRKSPEYSGIPFIIYTATYTGKQDEDLAKQIGADEFIVKPCEPVDFMNRVNEVIARTASRKVTDEVSTANEEDILKLYNERLVRKLEQKMSEMEREAIEKKEIVDALQRSEALLKATQSMEKFGSWEYDLSTKTKYWTEEMYRLHDMDPSLEYHDLWEKHLSCYTEEDRQKANSALRKVLSDGVGFTTESWFTTSRGRRIFIRASAAPVYQDGKISKVIGTMQDITERKQAEMEQNDLKEQLRQAKKLDSIGQLAGGIAHDFNNVLTVILGYAEEMQHSLHKSDPLYADINAIMEAGQRASSLTRQLLTFSRKQVIQPQTLNLNEIISNLHKMLMRLIGEDIEFSLDLAANLPNIVADTGQMEQVIMNLVINAREAMPMGGKLDIITSSFQTDEVFNKRHPVIKVGHYVILKVRDNGRGMDKDTKERIFEPFFTTKEKGQGTGLGLPTVYGIVRQAEGYIHVETAPGRGACFVILLPVSSQSLANQTEKVPEPKTKGNSELVLVVEDDPAISELTGKIIQKMGFQVLLAESADRALELIEDEGLRPVLVISDVIMPGLSGLELASILRFKRPQIKIILMSGYTESVIKTHGELDPGIPFIQKPFTRAELSDKIKEAMIS